MIQLENKIKQISLGNNSMKAYLGDRKIFSQNQPALTSLVFDQSVSDPANISGFGQGAIRGITAKMRRCLCKKTAEGEVKICYLNNENSNFYHDGTTASVLTGNDGDVMVYMPEFWYKYVPIDDTHFGYDLSLENLGEGSIHIGESLLGAYKSRYLSGKLYSRSGVSPSGSITHATNITFANARGAGYNIIDFEQHCMLALLFYAKYGTRDSQAILGVGSASTSTAVGSTNSLGNADTVAASSGHVSFAGIEGVFGAMSEFVSGITNNANVWNITNPDGTTRVGKNGVAELLSGYIKEIAAANGPYFDVLPISVGGSDSSYYADNFYQGESSNLVLSRAYGGNSKLGGISNGVLVYYSGVSANYTSRLAFRGTIIEEPDIQAFKNLPLL